MTRTYTYTKTNTFTREETVILAALNQASIPIDFIALASRTEQLGKDEGLKIDQELCLTITGQLIERGLIDRVRVRDDGDFFYRHA